MLQVSYERLIRLEPICVVILFIIKLCLAEFNAFIDLKQLKWAYSTPLT